MALAPGSSATITVDGTVAADATGVLSNTATVQAPAGVLDTVSGNNSATDDTTLTPKADVRIAKDDGFAVALIPHTLVVTTLADLGMGDRVNLEVDILSKYVQRALQASGVLPTAAADRAG